MDNELQTLREEVARLRERVAVLEAERRVVVPPLQQYPYPYTWPYTVTCNGN